MHLAGFPNLKKYTTLNHQSTTGEPPQFSILYQIANLLPSVKALQPSILLTISNIVRLPSILHSAVTTVGPISLSLQQWLTIGLLSWHVKFTSSQWIKDIAIASVISRTL